MTTQDTAPVADPPVALHASASEGYKCADCQMDGEACPDCYKAWWQQRHPNTILVNSDSTPPDSLAVAQALEMAAKVLRKRLDGIYEEHSYQEEDTGAVIVDRAYDSQAEILEEMEESIRALIPADSAEQVKVGREDTELLDWMESHPWEAYQVIGDANHASEEGQNPNYRAAIAAARDTK